jgi:uncharacterized protein YecE (DUF72 family)
MTNAIAIGTAGWTIPSAHAHLFPPAGSHLERYARRLHAVEINSTFYRPHRPETLARWAAAVPADFRFAVKVPKEITHERRLVDAVEPLELFLTQVGLLGDKLGPLLVQLAPSFEYDEAIARAFFSAVRDRHAGDVVCEPRHPTWFNDRVSDALADLRIARVAADPAPVPEAAAPGGWSGLAYYRLHGAPRMYFSAYADDDLARLATRLAADARHAPTWCIFDNTAHGHAAANAVATQKLLQARTNQAPSSR